jgi:hypothetical protein
MSGELEVTHRQGRLRAGLDRLVDYLIDCALDERPEIRATEERGIAGEHRYVDVRDWAPFEE